MARVRESQVHVRSGLTGMAVILVAVAAQAGSLILEGDAWRYYKGTNQPPAN